MARRSGATCRASDAEIEPFAQPTSSVLAPDSRRRADRSIDDALDRVFGHERESLPSPLKMVTQNVSRHAAVIVSRWSINGK